jgi:hypothetical protein
MHELLQHANALLNNPAASLKELNAVYVCLTGTTCRTVAKIRYKLQEFTDHPTRFERRVQHYYTDKAEQMAPKKYRFSAAYLKAGEPNIILHAPFLMVVKKDQLTDEKAALLAQHPQFHVYVEALEEEAPAPVVVPKKKRTAKKSA